MPLRPVRPIANRFELVLVILLGFVLSTRLTWLQMTRPATSITNDFYSTSMSFKRSLADQCAVTVGRDYPYSSISSSAPPDLSAPTSPGLALVFLGLCQFEDLSVASYIDMAPQFISVTAFMVAATARILTSSWVAGMIAASVVLSRGSIVKATDLAGAYSILQPAVCLFFLLLAIYSRDRTVRWLPFLFVALGIATVISPSIFLMAWPIAGILAGTYNRSQTLGAQQKQNSPTNAIVIASGMIALTAMTAFLAKVAPSSVKPIAIFATRLWEVLTNPTLLMGTIESLWLIISQEDAHWWASLIAITISTHLRHYLPEGSALYLKTLVATSLVACTLDCIIISAPSNYRSAQIDISRFYEIPASLASMEPLILGLGAGLVWFTIRSLLLAAYPGYSSAS